MTREKSDVFDEIRVLLAEKRTSLSVLRTGFALFTIPVSVFTVFIAASEYYVLEDVLYLIVSLIGISIVLKIFGAYLIGRSISKIHKLDSRVKN